MQSADGLKIVGSGNPGHHVGQGEVEGVAEGVQQSGFTGAPVGVGEVTPGLLSVACGGRARTGRL